MDIHKVIGKLLRSKRGFVSPYHKYTEPYNPLYEQLDEYDQPVPGQDQYNAADAISMRHVICYRDSNSKDGKKCDDIMLQEFREKFDRKLVRSIIGKKSGIMSWQMNYINQYDESLLRDVYLLQVRMQYGLPI